MIILISSPTFFSHEATMLSAMLEKHVDLIVHLRKPNASSIEFENLLKAIHSTVHSRIVIHQHHMLNEEYGLKGIHYSENERMNSRHNLSVISTSFHNLDDAKEFQQSYEYFFCSPVFPSISKPDYFPTESWHITNESIDFKKKAVGLGGISRSTLPAIKEKGFQQVAVLGAIWENSNPEKALHELIVAFQ